MKARIVFLSSIALIFLYLAIISPAINRARQHQRAELYLLDTIKAKVSQALDAGGQLPTNWISLSNSVDWDLVLGICEYNHLPPPAESYTVLKRAVTNEVTGGFCFLLSSKPTKWPAMRVGRWALVVGPRQLPAGSQGRESTNTIWRTWLPEEFIKAEIRTQLTSHP